jgi:hypothetical protein
MHIDSYEFGRIVIDGVSYNGDCLIVGGQVSTPWWRREGHRLSEEDVAPVISVRPSIVVVGCGAWGMMKVPGQTRQLLRAHGIDVEVLDTHGAVKRFNELSACGASVAAALHLTC